MRLARPAAVLVAVCVAASPARAADEPPVPLTYDWAVDGVVTGAFAASTLTPLLLRDDLGPLQCKWCTPGSVDGDVARSVAWANPKAASTLSDVLIGAAVGSLVGWAVPVLFHPPRKGAPQPGARMATPAGIAIAC